MLGVQIILKYKCGSIPSVQKTFRLRGIGFLRKVLDTLFILGALKSDCSFEENNFCSTKIAFVHCEFNI